MNIIYHDENGKVLGADSTTDIDTFKTELLYITQEEDIPANLFSDYVVDINNKVLVKKTDAEILSVAVEKLKVEKLKTINSDYVTAEALPVPYMTTEYAGGIESVRSIDEYVRLNRLAGNTTHTIWDINGIDTVLSDAEVDGLILAIGTQSSTHKFTKKNRKLALQSAKTIAEVEAV